MIMMMLSLPILLLHYSPHPFSLSLSHPLSLFFLSYSFLYLFAFFLIFHKTNWPRKLLPEASSCIISLAHGTPAAFFAFRAILSDPSPNFHSPNTPSQSLVLDYNIAYFLVDLLHYLIFHPSDLLFIAHHLATLFVFLTCRFLVFHGAFAILVLLILAEVTSFCQNLWTLAASRRSDSYFAARLHSFLSPPFYAFYTLVRGFLGPYFVFRMLSFYLTGAADAVIPKWVWISWIFVVLTAISVSILWISNLWVELYKQRVNRDQKKLS